MADPRDLPTMVSGQYGHDPGPQTPIVSVRVQPGVPTEGEDASMERLLRDLTRGPSAAPPSARLALDIVGRYTLGERLGAGGMGVVYRAWDRVLQRPVALKVLSESLKGRPEFCERLSREARAAARISSPYVASIYDLSVGDDGAFIAMELVEGRTLRGMLADGPLSHAQALTMSLQLAEGLAAAHASGVVHRDLKPDNVIVTPSGAPKILDFGLARLDAPAGGAVGPRSAPVSLTGEGAVIGTPPYMSPEQMLGERPASASDVFSLGVVIYELFVGRRLFQARSMDELQRDILGFRPASIAASLPAHPVRDVILRCLDDKPVRYGDAAQVLSALRAACDVASRPVVTPAAAFLPTPVFPGALALPFHCPRCALQTTAQVLLPDLASRQGDPPRTALDDARQAQVVLSMVWCPRCNAPPPTAALAISEWETHVSALSRLRRRILIGGAVTALLVSGGCGGCVIASPTPGKDPSDMIGLAVLFGLPWLVPVGFAVGLAFLLAGRRRPPPVVPGNPHGVVFPSLPPH